MNLRLTMVATLTLLAAGCTFVQLNDSAQSVRLLSAEEAASCKRLGKTTVSTLPTLAGMPRHEESIRDELITLARNSAADMKGDAITPVGQVADGKLTFLVYRCRGE